jgi:hypothetical protein
MTALTPARITLRLHRFEIVAFLLAAVLGVVATIVVAARLDALGYGGPCVEAMRVGAATPVDCEFKINQFYEIVSNEAGVVSTLGTIVPFVAALLLGVAVVGREIERGTTRLAWALTPSRQRWFLHRFLPVLLVVAGGTYVLGIAADRLLAATEPGIDPANAFAQFGFRGVVLAARAVFVLALALLVGAVMGRALPAVIVGGIIAAFGIAGGMQVHDRILRSEAVIIEEAHAQVGDLYVDQQFRLPDGRLIGWEEVEQYDPSPTDPNFTGQWPTLPTVNLAVPGSRYREVELREVGVLAGGSLVLLLATAVVIQRRRPG